MSAESNQVASSATSNTPKKRGRPKKVVPQDVSPVERPSAPHNPPNPKQYMGYKGECVRVRINRNPNEAQFDALVTPTCGDLPKFKFRCNVPLVMPIELYNTLLDTTVVVPASGTCGPDEVRQDETLVRIPTQYLGPATWEDFQAFLAENRPKPLNPPKNR